MKKLLSTLLIVCMMFLLLPGCKSKEAFKLEDITIEEVESKLGDKEDFYLLVERDNCPFCSKLNDYIEESKGTHGGLMVYRLDVTSYELKKPSDDARTLVSEDAYGKRFLAEFPYFYYTPTIYRIEKGVPVKAGVGYNVNNQSVAIWGVDSTADLDTASEVPFWDFLEGKD